MRPIRLNQEHLETLKAQVNTMLNMYNADENLTLKLDTSVVTADVSKPIVFLTTTAYVKMTHLIHNCNKELAWHGTVSKINNNYLIEDILVYPQTVTSTTVDSDDEKYPLWCMNLNDEVINKLRFQGHSHVNMGTSPSGRDTTNWKNFLNILKEDEFYIFCIGNKKGEYYWTIYDNAINIMFENKDITWMVVDEAGNNIVDWTKEQIETHITETKFNTISPNISANQYMDKYFSQEKSTTKNTPNASSTVYHRTVLDDDLIPIGLRGNLDIDFDPQSDTFFSYSYIPGFEWSNLWHCYSMAGDACRERYGYPTINNAADIKKKRGRPPKGAKKK
jgi:hypothetical protein